jgi:hypothetical protein
MLDNSLNQMEYNNPFLLTPFLYNFFSFESESPEYSSLKKLLDHIKFE